MDMEIDGKIGGFRLMIVDDSSIIRQRIARVVEMGMIPDVAVVGLAKNGKEAVQMCRQHLPDVVTMDLTMPEMDGVTCIEHLIQVKPTMQILVISALKDKATALEALHSGANGFVCKPFTDKQLANAFNELLGRL
jgi:two-component system, chemotaxis family, chemotaxis protein CheY